MKSDRLRSFSIPRLIRPSTSFSKRLRNKRAGAIEEAEALAIIAILGVAAVAFMSFAHIGPFSVAGGASGSGVTYCGNQNYATPLALKFSDSAVQGGSALTSPTADVFYSSGQGFSGDNPGSLSSAVTTSGSYSLQSGDIVEYTATGAYPIWAALNVPTGPAGPQPFALQNKGGINTLTVLPANGVTAGTCVWALQATQIAAPSSGTSATTNVIAGASSSDTAQSFATSNGGTISSSSVTWTASLSLKQADVGAGYTTNAYSTSAGSVVNYASGAGSTVPQGQSVPFVTELLVFSNRTTFNIGLETPGLTMTAITNTGLTSSTEGYVVTGFHGCNVTQSSSVTTCLSAAFNVYSTDSSHHTAVTFIWVDETQPGYAINHATDPAVTGFPSIGSAAGIPTNFGGITVPTGYPDNNAPTITIESSYTVIQIS